MNSVTAHCLVKNEENFIYYAVKSVINYVDKVIIFDTGSTDKTVELIQKLVKEYPEKIIFEEKGPCDKIRHTQLRQEMLDRTKTNWFMILDGDEIWTKRGMEDALKIINENKKAECLVAPFYLCIGDVFHRHYKSGLTKTSGKNSFSYPRFLKIIDGLRWRGDYDKDTLVNKRGEVFFNSGNTILLKNKYWHVTHLMRSGIGIDYSSGDLLRWEKVVNTYFLIGRKIKEPAPEVFGNNTKQLKLIFFKSFINFWIWNIKKLTKNFGN